MGLALPSFPFLPAESSPSEEDRVREVVKRVISGLTTPYRGIERRRDKRHPYPYAIYLTPVNDQTRSSRPEPIAVIGKHLSERGLDFYCREPLAERLVVASLESGPDEWVELLLDLTWCRFTRFGWYENGGRFVSVANMQALLGRKTA